MDKKTEILHHKVDREYSVILKAHYSLMDDDLNYLDAMSAVKGHDLEYILSLMDAMPVYDETAFNKLLAKIEDLLKFNPENEYLDVILQNFKLIAEEMKHLNDEETTARFDIIHNKIHTKAEAIAHKVETSKYCNHDVFYEIVPRLKAAFTVGALANIINAYCRIDDGMVKVVLNDIKSLVSEAKLDFTYAVVPDNQYSVCRE